MATYVNNLRLKEIATGDESGTWGTSTNTNLELIGQALGFGTEGITTNADTHSSTVGDGAADEARAIYLKYTGTLDSACTITIGPNTMKRFQIIENATSGSQSIIISQGSGANITIKTGAVKAVYLDGAGSGAAVLDALVDLDLTGTTTAAAVTASGALTGGTVIAGSSAAGTTVSAGNISLKNGGTQSTVKFYCESNNAHYAQIQAPAHSAFSGNVTLTLPATTSNLVGDTVTQTMTNKTLTSPVLNTGVSGTAVLDSDTMSGASATKLASSESIKAYVDSQVSGVTPSSTTTFTNKTLTAAKIVDGGFLADANGNELIKMQTTSSAVNELEVTNAATGGAVVIGTSGGDSNVDLTLTPKGTGEVNIATGNLNYSGTAVTATGAELNYLDTGAAVGTVVASKAVTVDSDKDASGFRNVTLTETLTSANLTIDSSTFVVKGSTNRIGILNSSPDVTLDIGTATDAVHMPVGSTGQRPGSPAAGYFRYNSTTGGFEGYTTEWGEIGGGGANLTTNNYTGNGSTTGFTLAINPSVEQNTFVYIDGVYQQKNTYSTSGTTLTFSTAPPSSSSIEVMSMTATNSIVGTVSDNAITTAKIVNGNVTLAKMAANSVDSDQYVDGSIDTVHIADDQVTGAKLANSVDVTTGLTVGGASNGVAITNGQIALKNSGTVSKLDFYCESNNAHYTRLQSAPHGSYSGNIVLTLPASDGDSGQSLTTNGSGVMAWSTIGGEYNAWAIITTNTSLALKGQYIANDSSARTHTLPSGSAGSTITIKNNGSGLVTLARTSSQKINGVDANATMPQGNAVQLVYVDGTTGWLVL